MNQSPNPYFTPFSPPDNTLQIEKFAKKYRNARHNLLLIPIFTILNLVMLISGMDIVFLFSATIPYFIAGVGVYTSELLMGAPGIVAICFVIALAITALYFPCYAFSKKYMGWMVAALVLFSLDSLLMLGLYLPEFDLSLLIDIAIHGWVLYYLITGVHAGAKLKTLTEGTYAMQGAQPYAPPIPQDTATPLEQTLANLGPENTGKIFSNLPADGSDALPLRSADTGTKARIFVEADDAAGHHLCFRRVKLPAVRKRVNELVIDGYVYAETSPMNLESPHTLYARLNGQVYSAGYDGKYSYLLLNGVQLAKKIRLY